MARKFACALGNQHQRGIASNKRQVGLGPELARRLSDADLIDRYNLLVFPVLLGAGKSLFSRDDRDKRQLRLRESASYSNGVTKLLSDVVY